MTGTVRKRGPTKHNDQKSAWGLRPPYQIWPRCPTEPKFKLITSWFITLLNWRQNMYFPMNMYYPSRFRKHACAVIESRFGCAEDDPALETAVYKSAEETLTLLSRRLGSEPYLFGKAPSSADAVMYAHLVRLSWIIVGYRFWYVTFNMFIQWTLFQMKNKWKIICHSNGFLIHIPQLVQEQL